MLFKREELFKLVSHPQLIIVSTNGFLAKKGLVMGRGCAYELTQRIPGIAVRSAVHIRRVGSKPTNNLNIFLYGFTVLQNPTDNKVGIGLFQVKYNWSSKASVFLLKYSAHMLAQYAKNNPATHIRMPLAGAGFGRLNPQECRETLSEFLSSFDNLVVCYKSKRSLS